MLSKVNPDVLAKARVTEYSNTKRESVGQGHQWELRANSTEEWYIEPHLWAGISIVRSGAGMAIVSSYQQVAAPGVYNPGAANNLQLLSIINVRIILGARYKVTVMKAFNSGFNLCIFFK